MDVKKNILIIYSHTNKTEFRLDLNLDFQNTLKIKFRETNDLEVIDLGDDVADFLNKALNRVDLRLVKESTVKRDMEASLNADKSDSDMDFSMFENDLFNKGDLKNKLKSVEKKDELVWELNFGNRSSLCFLSMETVDEVNKFSGESLIEEESYRANVILKGCEKPYSEDTWAHFALIGDTEMHFVYVRSAPRRCCMMSIDQKTGVLDKEKKNNKIIHKAKSVNGKIASIGALAAAVKGKSDGLLKVGDRVKVLEYISQ